MDQQDGPHEEFSFRFWTWELKAKKPGKNTIIMLMIISVLIIALVALVKYA
jgi:hypothetical protein